MSRSDTARILVRAASLAFFLLLLARAYEGAFFGIPSDLYLRMDPLAGALTPLAERSWLSSFWPALALIALTLVFGRFFCGWLCPMGASLDGASFLLRRCLPKWRLEPSPSWRRIKYMLLALMAAAAFFGLNLYFWGSPIALVTRFYALFLAPCLHWLYNLGLETARPLLEKTGAASLLYGLQEAPVYASLSFVISFWLALFLLEWLCPRFWCRYLCPAGALLSLAARFRIFRRVTGGQCNACGLCAKKCPAGLPAARAAGEDSECLICGSCQSACPKKALTFSFLPARARPHALSPASRRAFMGAGAAALIAGGLSPLLIREGRELVRPPGALPETDFLAACLRCGQCMAACPDKALQPAFAQGGLAAIFSPRLDPYSGACEVECAACGQVCPSQAIQPLTLAQKRWAKIGTAVIDNDSCLAWHDDKRCMVCKENCPYNAVDVISREGYIAPVPIVHANYCYGCGFCQKACPTAPASIIVSPEGALRLAANDFEAVAKKAGLDFTPGRQTENEPEPSDAPPPGFLE